MSQFWKIQRGEEVIGKKIPSMGGVWIFSGTTHHSKFRLMNTKEGG